MRTDKPDNDLICHGVESTNPFEYAPGEEPPRPQHKPIGVCECCGETAYTKVDSVKVCWPCAYHLAN